MTEPSTQPESPDPRLADLIEQATNADAADGAAAMADQLRDKLPETQSAEEELGDSED